VIFPGRAEQTGAHRRLANDGVTREHILDSHTGQTVERCGAEQRVRAIQDTTTLNCDGRAATADRDDLGGGGTGVTGLRAPVGITVNAVGRPLGLFMAPADFRQAPGQDNRRWVPGLERAPERAAACPRTRIIKICDREGDVWPLLAHADKVGQALLVRATRGLPDRSPGPHARCLGARGDPARPCPAPGRHAGRTPARAAADRPAGDGRGCGRSRLCTHRPGRGSHPSGTHTGR